MLLRPFLYEETACASYLFGCLSRASLAVVDPHVEMVETYLEAAERAGAPIAAVFASSGEMIERLLAGRIHLALVGETAVDDRIELEPFLSDEIVGIARPGSLPMCNGKVKADALGAQTLLVREAGSSTRQVAERALQAAQAEPSRVWELDSDEAIERAAREGLGVAFLSRYAVAEEVERGELARFRLAGRPPIERRLYIARLARRQPSPSERGFITKLTRCCSKSTDFAAACVR
jgi:DNA-binding transcriptional LysR family regulator